MGCDIHCIVEKKDQNGMWKAVKGQGFIIKMYKEWLNNAIKENDTEHIAYCKKRIAEERKEQGLSSKWIFDDRNYELFALLADVRNYDGWPSLFAGRGIPPLPSITTQFELRDWGGDAHSWTYFSLKDIKEAKWDQNVIKTAIVEDETWEEYLQHPEWKRPKSYCGWSSSTTARERSWEVSYRDIAERFFEIVISKMEKLSKHTPYRDEGVRLVVFFDN